MLEFCRQRRVSTCASTIIKTNKQKTRISILPRKSVERTFPKTKDLPISLRSSFLRAFSHCANYGTVLSCRQLVYLVLCPEYTDTLHAMKHRLGKGILCLFLNTVMMFRALDGKMLACAPASPAQGLHRHGPWHFNFHYLFMTRGLENLGHINQN